MIDSALFAGMRPDLSTLPSTTTDFIAQTAIRSVTLTGGADGSFTFASSTIAAYAIGRVQFGTVDGNSGAAPFGVAARFIVAYSRNGHAVSRNLGFAGDFDHENNYFVRIIA
jgi:hypothetical protein